MRYTVHIRSVPGMYAQYAGVVKVDAPTEAQAVRQALDRLKRTTFPDRNDHMCRITKIERGWQGETHAG
jgi:hypothetical protein